MTIQAMAQQALDVQDACNLSGVVRTFADITSAMRLVHHFDTATCNRHPVSQLFADKIADLTGARSQDDYSAAYAACQALAAPPRPDLTPTSEPHVVGLDAPTPDNDPVGRFTPTVSLDALIQFPNGAWGFTGCVDARLYAVNGRPTWPTAKAAIEAAVALGYTFRLRPATR